MTQNILAFSTIGLFILASSIGQFASALSPNAREFVTQNITLPDGRQAEIKMVKPAYHYGVWCDGVTITVE